MKKLIISTLVLGSALAIGACNKDKKPATADPGMPAATEPAKTDPAAAGEPAKPDEAKPAGDKPATGGW